jgi:RNA polymerase sigma-70 factor (ECF subfamily)
MSEQELTALAFAAGRGDRDAVTALIQATQRDLLRFLGAQAAPGDVEDLAQETYLRALRALPQFAGHSSVRTWLFSIARRVAVDQVRRAVRQPRLTAAADWQSAADAADAVSGPRFDEQHALTELLAGLLPERRAAFVATQIAGLSYAEAAEVCGCPVGTIRSRVARARDDQIAAMREPTAGTAGAAAS